MCLGYPPDAEVRFLDEDGNMVVTNEGQERYQQTLAEANRILNASSDLEILMVNIIWQNHRFARVLQSFQGGWSNNTNIVSRVMKILHWINWEETLPVSNLSLEALIMKMRLFIKHDPAFKLLTIRYENRRQKYLTSNESLANEIDTLFSCVFKLCNMFISKIWVYHWTH